MPDLEGEQVLESGMQHKSSAKEEVRCQIRTIHELLMRVSYAINTQKPGRANTNICS